MQLRENKYRKSKNELMSTINVTPFVEILFVLLITFMVAAPALLMGVDIELPKTSAEMVKNDTNPIIVSIKSNGVIYINENGVKLSDFSKKLVRVANGDLNAKILIKGDKRLNYERVMSVLGKVSGTGFQKIVLVSETE